MNISFQPVLTSRMQCRSTRFSAEAPKLSEAERAAVKAEFLQKARYDKQAPNVSRCLANSFGFSAEQVEVNEKGEIILVDSETFTSRQMFPRLMTLSRFVPNSGVTFENNRFQFNGKTIYLGRPQ